MSVPHSITRKPLDATPFAHGHILGGAAMIDGADKLLMAHAHRQIALANARIAALEAEVIALSAASNKQSMAALSYINVARNFFRPTI